MTDDRPSDLSNKSTCLILYGMSHVPQEYQDMENIIWLKAKIKELEARLSLIPVPKDEIMNYWGEGNYEKD